MKLREITVKNFRCLADVSLSVSDNTILVGENNSGKTALLDALRIALPWRAANGRTSPFDEYDYHMSKTGDSPDSGKGIVIELWFREDNSDEWLDSLTQALTEIIQTDPETDIDFIGLRLSSKYDKNAKEIISKWEFLASDGQPLTGKGANTNNLSKFLFYIRCFYLSSLRDSNSEFSPKSSFWGRILRNLKIDEAQKKSLNEELQKLNAELLKADSMLEQVIETLEKGQQMMEPGTGQKTSIQALPLKPWDLMSKAEVVIKPRGSEIDFPLARHGQGMQSLAVLFLFQAYIDVLLKPTFKPETEAILALEEPEAHLHPQATRALASKLGEIGSQKIISTHSPYFIQEIPLTDIRMFRRKGASTKVLSIRQSFTAKIPQTQKLLDYCSANRHRFLYHAGKSVLTVKGKLEDKEVFELTNLYPNQNEIHAEIVRLKTESKLYLDDNELKKLEIYTRTRGDVFFARAWLLCEGQSEYLLLRYFGELMGTPLDEAGITVIDFQNNGSPGAFVGLAISFEIPCLVFCDNDTAAKSFINEVKRRGLSDEEINEFIQKLPGAKGTDLELFLITNGFISEYRQILQERNINLDKQEGEAGFEDEIVSKREKKHKPANISRLIEKLRETNADKSRVPQFFQKIISKIISKAE